MGASGLGLRRRRSSPLFSMRLPAAETHEPRPPTVCLVCYTYDWLHNQEGCGASGQWDRSPCFRLLVIGPWSLLLTTILALLVVLGVTVQAWILLGFIGGSVLPLTEPGHTHTLAMSPPPTSANTEDEHPISRPRASVYTDCRPPPDLGVPIPRYFVALPLLYSLLSKALRGSHLGRLILDTVLVLLMSSGYLCCMIAASVRRCPAWSLSLNFQILTHTTFPSTLITTSPSLSMSLDPQAQPSKPLNPNPRAGLPGPSLHRGDPPGQPRQPLRPPAGHTRQVRPSTRSTHTFPSPPFSSSCQFPLSLSPYLVSTADRLDLCADFRPLSVNREYPAPENHRQSLAFQAKAMYVHVHPTPAWSSGPWQILKSSGGSHHSEPSNYLESSLSGRT